MATAVGNGYSPVQNHAIPRNSSGGSRCALDPPYSGRWKGESHIAGGRSRLRRSLYAAALPAAFRWNKALKALYRRLVERGKVHTVALVACARKLLTFANAIVARGTPWAERPTAA